MEEWSTAAKKADAAVAEADKDQRRALALASDIAMPAVRAETLARIAQVVGGKDPEAAGPILEKCASLLAEVKQPGDRALPWGALAEAAWAAKDEKLAWDALHRAMADATELYRRDADPANPNGALRDFWPGVQASRMIVRGAVKAMGVRAEPLLESIDDPELALLAKIEMARALLGRPAGSSSMLVSR
jgi:hypothetical protein